MQAHAMHLGPIVGAAEAEWQRPVGVWQVDRRAKEVRVSPRRVPVGQSAHNHLTRAGGPRAVENKGVGQHATVVGHALGQHVIALAAAVSRTQEARHALGSFEPLPEYTARFGAFDENRAPLASRPPKPKPDWIRGCWPRSGQPGAHLALARKDIFFTWVERLDAAATSAWSSAAVVVPVREALASDGKRKSHRSR